MLREGMLGLGQHRGDASPVQGKTRRRISGWAALRFTFSCALVTAIFVFALPKVAALSGVFATMRAMTWLELTAIGGAAAGNLVMYWVVMMIVLPGLRMRQAIVANMTGGAISNTVPGGGAVAVGMTYAMLSSWGFTRSQIGLSVVLTGLWNTFVKLGLPVIALALLALKGGVGPGLLASALVGVAVLVLAVTAYGLTLRSRRFARWAGDMLGHAATAARRLVRKPPVRAWGDAAVRVRHETIELVRTRWFSLTGASVISHMALYVVLLLSLRFAGVSEAQVGWIEVLGAFAFIRLLTALPITPGGLGVVELGLTTALVVAGGDRGAVVAAVLLYRAVTWLPTVPAGIASYIAWRRRRQTAPADVLQPALQSAQ